MKKRIWIVLVIYVLALTGMLLVGCAPQQQVAQLSPDENEKFQNKLIGGS